MHSRSHFRYRVPDTPGRQRNVHSRAAGQCYQGGQRAISTVGHIREGEPLGSNITAQLIGTILREKIKTGALKPGQRLPIIHELCEQFSCSARKVLDAYTELESEGLIVRRTGSGVFVTGGVILGDRARRIVDVLRDEIVRHKLAPGTRLPLLDDIRARFDNPSPSIVMSVYDQLQTEGLIVRRRGVGIFVASGEPVQAGYERVRDVLRQEINNGTYEPGDQLPVGKLLKRFKVSQSTLWAAYRELTAEGLLKAYAGHGTFVAGGQPPRSNAVAAADKIRRQISDGTLKPGDRLPSAIVLAPEHGVGPSDVRRAFDTLKAEGVLVGRRGSGTYVAASSATTPR